MVLELAQAPVGDDTTEALSAVVDVPSTAISPNEQIAVYVQEYESIADILSGFITRRFRAGVDYGTVEGETQSGKKYTTKPALFKPGAEKITLAFGYRVKFVPDTATLEMAGHPAGLFALRCLLINRQGRVAGEGRGAAAVGEKKGWTVNSAVKVCEKRAHVDAILRVAGVSEHFAQEDDDHDGAGSQARNEDRSEQRTQARSEQRTQARSEQRTQAHGDNRTAGAPQATQATQPRQAPADPPINTIGGQKHVVWAWCKATAGAEAPQDVIVGEVNDFLKTHTGRLGATAQTATAAEWAKAATIAQQLRAQHAAQRRPPARHADPDELFN